MSEKTQIILLAISMIILVVEHYFIFQRLELLEKNQEVLRIAINKLNKERKSDNRNTNEVAKSE